MPGSSRKGEGVLVCLLTVIFEMIFVSYSWSGIWSLILQSDYLIHSFLKPDPGSRFRNQVKEEAGHGLQVPNLESGIPVGIQSGESEVDLSLNPRRNPELGFRLVLGIWVPFLTWFRTRVSDPVRF